MPQIFQDLEMCTKTQQTCSLLQDYKFIEPLKLQRTKHENLRKGLRDKWNKERKRLQYAVIQLKKAREIYIQRHQEYERCHEAVRIAEQGAEIGATAENKVDKRKRLEEDALQKTTDSESQYRMCVEEANERHRNILLVKTEILRGVRELIVECDQVMKEVTVNYFQQLHHTLNALPDHYASLCETSRLYEPGTQFLEYVKTMPEAQVLHSTMSDPFSFEPITGDAHTSTSSGHRIKSKSSDYLLDDSSGGHPHQQRRREAWTPSMGAIDPSDTESVESERSSPSGSPLVSTTQENSGHQAGAVASRSEQPVIYFDNDATDSSHQRGLVTKSASTATASSDHELMSTGGIPTSPTTPPRRPIMSQAATSHHFRKIKTPSKCRECDTVVFYFNGVDCSQCGLSSHKKCLETLALQCGHRRLPRKMAMFGVDLNTHTQEANTQIPTIVVKCVHEINDRGLTVQGIYRVSGAKQRIDRLCQAFENGPAELVDLTNIPPNVIADVLKNYMRQLPEPLLTNSLSPEFIHLAETYPNLDTNSAAAGMAPLATAESSSPPINANNNSSLDDDQRMAISKLRELCRRLPKAHYFTLAYLMHHLNRVAAEHEANSMTASNLAIVFAPTLMKTNKDIGLGAVDENKQHVRVIELLVVHASHIFGPPELVAPREPRNDHHHRGPRARGITTRSRGSRDSSDLISSQTERRGEVCADDFSIPGLVSSEDQSGTATGSNEDIFGASVSDDDDDADPIPIFLLEGGSSSRPGRSPMLLRGNSSPPLIIKQSLKNFSGLEGVTPGMLSTQDSLEAAQAQRAAAAQAAATTSMPLVSQTSAPVTSATAKRTVHHESSMPVAASSEVSTAVFHKVGKLSKKHSVDDNIFGEEQASEVSPDNKTPPPSSSSATSAIRSGSLSEEAASSSRRRSAKEMSQSMPATILNLEENRVTIQVPGVTPPRPSHPAVVKQSSIDRGKTLVFSEKKGKFLIRIRHFQTSSFYVRQPCAIGSSSSALGLATAAATIIIIIQMWIQIPTFVYYTHLIITQHTRINLL